MIADGDYVVRQQTCRAKTVHGNDYANTYCFVFRFDDDSKIVYLTEHWNTLVRVPDAVHELHRRARASARVIGARVIGRK